MKQEGGRRTLYSFIKEQTSKMLLEMYTESIYLKEVPFLVSVQWNITDLSFY